MNQFIFITGVGRCGTNLMLSLLEGNNRLNIIPGEATNLIMDSLNRKLNSMVRLSIYYSIILFLIKQESNVFCLLFIVLIMTVFIYKNDIIIDNAIGY